MRGLILAGLVTIGSSAVAPAGGRGPRISLSEALRSPPKLCFEASLGSPQVCLWLAFRGARQGRGLWDILERIQSKLSQRSLMAGRSVLGDVEITALKPLR